MKYLLLLLPLCACASADLDKFETTMLDGIEATRAAVEDGADAASGGLSRLEQILLAASAAAATIATAVKATNTVRDGRRKAKGEPV